MTYVEFFGGSYFLAWCSLWLLWAVVPLATLIYNLIANLLKTLRVLLRGYPPAPIYSVSSHETEQEKERGEG
jgi:hypothetical protein